MGAESTSPWAPVKCLADLRNRANSQWYSSIYEDRRPKIETLKDQMARRVLKDNKVPGNSAGTRAAETPCWGAGSAAGFLGESQAGLCERSGDCLDQGGLNRRNFSKRKRENRCTQWLFRELSAAAMASCSPAP